MAIQTLCILGGGGFIGRHLVALLAARGCRVRVPARRREDAKDLLVLPGVDVIEADIHDPARLRTLFAGMEIGRASCRERVS
jgi:NADH dehydrogenase